MDFSVLLKDLRDVAEKYQGKSTEPQVSTHAYVDMFTKILKRAQKVTEQYDDQITVLWVALNQLASIYKDLTAGAARDQLCKFIFGLCAKTVLNIQWSQLDEDSKVKNNFSTTVEDVHKILSQLGFFKFQLILDLMESHWTHPVLSKIMSGEEEDTEDCLEYIQKEDPDILKLRIEIMMKENCEEFALNLCNWSLKHPTLQNDLKIKEHQIFILYKQQEYGKMQEVCETIICHDGIKVMSHLAKTPSNQELCIRLAQVFLIQDWVKPERTCCTQELLKLWIHHQYLADKDEERFLDSIWTVAKVCRDTEQIGVLIDGVKKECGDMFIQLYSELCKFAINIDKGNMEREEVQKDPEEYNKRRLAMSKTCVRMAFMLKEYDFRISRICGLTAFSLDPTMDNLNLVNKLYWTMKNVSAASQNSKINIATLYEIERLLGQMRPDSLNPEYSWKQLIPVCKKYKLDYENDKNSIPLKIIAKKERTGSQSFGENSVTPVPHILKIDKSDEITKKIDTGQKKGRKPKNVVPKDIQKAHLAKMLGQKNLSREEIEKVLSNEFPRNVKKEFNNAPSLDVKELDKTINDLKKSIYLETQYRERIKNNLSSLQKCKKTKTEPDEKKQHLSRQDLFRQQQMMHQKEPYYQRQQSFPGGSQTHGPILQRQLSMGSPQPPNAHSHHRQQQMSPPFGGSPPPAHSTSPRMSSPIGFSSPISPSGFRQHSVSPNILSSRKSGSYSQINSSQTHSNIPQQLCNKIKAELQQKCRQKVAKTSDFNVLRPPGNSQQECAKIAQQIAEMHERQRAEKLQNARIQGQIDGVKVALNSRNIPSRSQISDLLSMTFQGSKGQNIVDQQKNASLHVEDTNHSKNYLKKKLERSASVSSSHNFMSPEIIGRASVPTQSADLTKVSNSISSSSQSAVPYSSSSVSNRSLSAGRIPNENHSSSSKVDSSMLVPGEQGWDPTRGIMKQKYYYKPAKSKDSVSKGSTGEKPLSMKPVYSMIVPKELTNPNRKEDLVKTVTDMMKRFPKGMQQKGSSSSIQSPEHSQTVLKVESQTSKISDQNSASSVQHLQNKTSPPKLIPTSSLTSVENDASMADNHSISQPPIFSVNSKSIGQNYLEEGLLNLNTLAAASMSVLGQDTSQQQVIGSLQLTQSMQQQPIQQQPQMFGNPVIESQPMFSPIQPVQVSVQQVVQQPETILATPLYTMPNSVIPEPVLTQQLAGIQPQVDIALQQPAVVQQIIAVQNQPIAMNNSQSFVNVVSQQPSFQVPSVGQVNFTDVTRSMACGQAIAGGMSPSINVGMTQQIPGGIASSVMNGISQSLSVPTEIIPTVNSTLKPQTSLEESVTSKQFLAPPELSPALVQQILSSLKKGGARCNNKIQIKGMDEKRAVTKRQKQQTTVVSKAKTIENEAGKDTIKQTNVNISERNGNQSVNEARQKILELRKQFERTAEPGSSLRDLSTVFPSSEVPISKSNTVASQRKSSGILERLMCDDKETKVNLEVQSSHFPSNTNSKKIDASQIPLVVSQQSLPELVDLGAKEFQLDSILALDNDNSLCSENTVPNKNIVPLNSNEPIGSHRISSTASENQELNNVQEMGLIDNNIPKIVPAALESNICTDKKRNVQGEKRQELTSVTSSQSTYFNANRLGKERENREMKSLHVDFEGQKQNVNTEQKLKIFCANCDLQFTTEQLLIDHKKVSHCEPKLKCAYCKMSFKCAEILKSHEKNYCMKAPSTMVRCCICGVYFQSHEQLKAHLNPKTCTPMNIFKEKTNSEEDIVCGICKRKFESMTLIKEHVKLGCYKKDNNTYSKIIKFGDFDFSVFFKCTKCNFMNLNENIVSKHVLKCKENNSSAKLTEMYACNMCEETFCVKEDACRHVKRQCTKLKVTNSQKQIQDVYQKMNDLSTAEESKVKGKKTVDQKNIKIVAKEKLFNDVKEKQADRTQVSKDKNKSEKDICDKPTTEIEQQKSNLEDLKLKTAVSKVNVEKGTDGTIKTITKENFTKGKTPQSSDKSKVEDKVTNTDENKPKVSDPLKSVYPPSDDRAAELTAEMQKVQRITAENRFLAEFNEIEKRKQAIRMKKQKELEKQQEILIKKEKEKELELIKQKKLQHTLEEDKNKLRKVNEKHGKDKNTFDTEKEHYITSMIGTSTLQQKMIESVEKEKKGRKYNGIEDKNVSIKVVNVFRNEKKSLKQEENCNVYKTKVEPKPKIKTENVMAETESINNDQDDKTVGNVVNKKRKKSLSADIENKVKLSKEKRVLREHVEESGRKARRKQFEKSESSKKSHRILKKKQYSHQDIRKLRGLREKRLIKKQKYFIDEMEPIQRDKLKKDFDNDDGCKNVNQRIKQNHQHRKIRTEIKGQEIDPVHKENKRDGEKDRIKSKCNSNNASADILQEGDHKDIVDSGELNENQIKEENQIYWRKVCRFCGLSNRGNNILSHYVQTHKLGFRQISYSYYCNFCNMKFPITQTVQVKEHVFNNHREAVLGRVAIGRYDKKVESSSLNCKSVSPVISKRVSQRSGNVSKRRKHQRALELRKKCAEKLREITLVRKNSIIDISDLEEEEESQASCYSNHSTDVESPYKQTDLASTGRKWKSANDESEVRHGRRIAPRLARQMVKNTMARSKRINYFEEEKKSSDKDDSSDTQVMTRSRSSSVSSGRSSLIASAKKRKSAIVIVTRGSLKSRQKRSGSLLHTRSGRAVKRPEIDYDKLTESSSVGSGEDNSELEDVDIRKRKSTRIRRLSEKGKSYRGTTSDTDESSTEEIKRRVTRRSFSKSEKEKEGNMSDSHNDTNEEGQVIENKRPRIGQSPGRKSNNDPVEFRSVKNKSKKRENVSKAERVITRQISKNEEESDSETESNYTDIEHVVKMLGDKNVRNAAIGSAESDSESTSANEDILERKYRLRKDSESTSANEDILERKYRLRKRHLNKKYRETESSDEEVNDIKENDETEAESVSDIRQSGDTSMLVEKSKNPNCNISIGEREYGEKPKVVLIGAEEDDDLNVDYGHLKRKSDYSNSQARKVNLHSKLEDIYNPDQIVKNYVNQGDGISPNIRTVLIDPQDEFAGLEAAPENSLDKEKGSESENTSNSVSAVDTEVVSSILPTSVMDVDEFEFLKSYQTTGKKINESNLNSSSNSSHKAAYDKEFIRYTKAENNEYSSDSEFDMPDKTNDNLSNIDNDLIASDLSRKNLDIQISPLAEDVPVLPPRDLSSDRKKLIKHSGSKEILREKKSIMSLNQNVSPLLKSARVVIEDISVVRKALETDIIEKNLTEIDTVEKKLIHECEASSCLVRIGRLSKEEIEKHTPSSRKTAKENMEYDLIRYKSDVENITDKPEGKVAVCNESDESQNNTNKKVEKNLTDDAKAVKFEEQQYETLIQDIVLDDSFIDQLLVNESITVNIQSQEQKAEDQDSSSFEVVILEDSNTNHNSALLVVDVDSSKNAENQSNDEANNVFTVIAKSEVDTTSDDLDENTNQIDAEEDIWIENAETYAETPILSENSESIVYSHTFVQVTDEETLNIPDYSKLPDLPKEEHIVLTKLPTNEKETVAGETHYPDNEITSISDKEDLQQVVGTECEKDETSENDEKTERTKKITDSVLLCDSQPAEYLNIKSGAVKEAVKYAGTDLNQSITLSGEINENSSGEINEIDIANEDENVNEDQNISSKITYQQTIECNPSFKEEKMTAVCENEASNNILHDQNDQMDLLIPGSLINEPCLSYKTLNDNKNHNAPPRMEAGNNLELCEINENIEEKKEESSNQQEHQLYSNEDVEMMHKASEPIIKIKDKNSMYSSKRTEISSLISEKSTGENAFQESIQHHLQDHRFKEGSSCEESKLYLSNKSKDLSFKMIPHNGKEADETLSINTESEFKENYPSEVPIIVTSGENAKFASDVSGQENCVVINVESKEELPVSKIDNDMDNDNGKSSNHLIGITLKENIEVTDNIANSENESDRNIKEITERDANEKKVNPNLMVEHIYSDIENRVCDQSTQQHDVESSNQNDVKVILSEICVEVARTANTLEIDKNVGIMKNLDEFSGRSAVDSLLTTQILKETSTESPSNDYSLELYEETGEKCKILELQKFGVLEKTDNTSKSEENVLLNQYSLDSEVSQEAAQKAMEISFEEVKKIENLNESSTSSNSSLLALQTYSDSSDIEVESVKKFEIGEQKSKNIEKCEETFEVNRIDSIKRNQEIYIIDNQKTCVGNLSEVQEEEMNLKDSKSNMTEGISSDEVDKEDIIKDNSSDNFERSKMLNEKFVIQNQNLALDEHDLHETALQTSNTTLENIEIAATVTLKKEHNLVSSEKQAGTNLGTESVNHGFEYNFTDKKIASVKPIDDKMEGVVDTDFSKTDELLTSDKNVDKEIDFHSVEEKIGCENKKVNRSLETESNTEPKINIDQVAIEEQMEHLESGEVITEIMVQNKVENIDFIKQQTVTNEDNLKGLCTMNDDEVAKSTFVMQKTEEFGANEDGLTDKVYLDILEESEHPESTEVANEKEDESASNVLGSLLDQHRPKSLCGLVKANYSLSETDVNCFIKGKEENVKNDANTIQDPVQIGMEDVQEAKVLSGLNAEDVVAVVRQIVDNVNTKLKENVSTEVNETLPNLDHFHKTSDMNNSDESESENLKSEIDLQTNISSSSDISLISFPEYTEEQNEQLEGHIDKADTVNSTVSVENTESSFNERSVHELTITEESHQKSPKQIIADSTIERSEEITIELPFSEKCDTQFPKRNDQATEINKTLEKSCEVDKIEASEKNDECSNIPHNVSDTDVSEEKIVKCKTKNFELHLDKSFEICEQNKDLVEKTHFDEVVVDQTLVTSEKDVSCLDKSTDYSKIETQKNSENDKNKNNSSESSSFINKVIESFKVEEKSDDQNQNNNEEMKKVENAQEVKHFREENAFISEQNFNIRNDAQQDKEQIEENESKQQSSISIDTEENPCEAFISSGSINEKLLSEQDEKLNEQNEKIHNIIDNEKDRPKDEKMEMETSVDFENRNIEEISNVTDEETSALRSVEKDVIVSQSNMDLTTPTTRSAERNTIAGTDEEDPTLDKWVKEILNQEAEEKVKVFELPSPRRKGMIVGATCVHKKPTNPFVETRTFKREESPKKDRDDEVKMEARKEYDEKNEKSNLEKSKDNTFSQKDAKTEITEDSDNLNERKLIHFEKQSASSMQNKQVNTEKIKSKATAVKKSTKDNSSSSSKDDQKYGQNKHLRSDTTRVLNASSEVQGKEVKERKLDDSKSRNQRNIKQKPAESKNIDKEQNVNQLSLNLNEEKSMNLKSIEKTSPEKGYQFEEVQHADETDVEFRRRTEAVRSARRKSSVKPYESDFNFEDNGKKFKEADCKVTPSTSFWPSDNENFDTASLYSSSSGSSGNTGGLKDGKLKVIERCARDFGKDEVVKPRIQQQLPRTVCSLPDKKTVSAMAMQIINSIGTSITNPVSTTAICTGQKYASSNLSKRMKVIDKNTLSNIALPGKMVDILKSSDVENSLSITTSNIKKITSQLNIGKESSSDRKNKNALSQEKPNKVADESIEDKTAAGIDVLTDEKHTDVDIEPCQENFTYKALRALRKNDTPFKWENSPSPPKILRSQTYKGDCKTSDDSAKPKGKPETRQAKEKLLKLTQTNTTSHKNVRDSKKKVCDKSYHKVSEKQDTLSEQMSTIIQVRKTRLRDKNIDRDSSCKRETRSRSGSKDKLKVDKQILDKPIKNRKQNISKSEHNDADSKNNINVIKAEGKNMASNSRTVPMKQRHLSGDDMNDTERDQAETVAVLNESKEIKTRKRKSDIKKEHKTQTESSSEPVIDSSKLLPEEPAIKICKLDGTANSPEKNEESVCGHKLTIPGCDHCIERQFRSQNFGMETSRPAVRQIIHGGKVFQIQRGSVTETDIQSLKGERRAVTKELFSKSVEDQAMKRSKRIERRKRAHSPEDVVHRNVEVTQGSVGLLDINKYISQTLRDIKKQRDGHSNSKWTVKQKKSFKNGLPYSFKKANSKL